MTKIFRIFPLLILNFSWCTAASINNIIDENDFSDFTNNPIPIIISIDDMENFFPCDKNRTVSPATLKRRNAIIREDLGFNNLNVMNEFNDFNSLAEIIDIIKCLFEI